MCEKKMVYIQANNRDNERLCFQVLFFPSPTKHFGYLVLVTFTSVFAGLCFFVLFLWFVHQQSSYSFSSALPFFSTGEADD